MARDREGKEYGANSACQAVAELEYFDQPQVEVEERRLAELVPRADLAVDDGVVVVVVRVALLVGAND